MSFKWILKELNIFGKCKQYRLPLWKCPQFLFLIMGSVIIITALITYALGTRYFVAEPNTVSLIVIGITVVLLFITFSIIKGMEGLAEASRLKSEFISIVSHQLRSPLSNLKWALEVLHSERFGGLEPKQKEYIKILQENSGRMGELITDLLIVSRIDEGRLPLSQTQFSLGELIKELIDEFKALAEASNVTINFEQAELLPRAFGDVKMVQIVIENLIDNAIRYIKGRGEISIKLQNSGNNLLFEIKDTGVGIPADDQKRIFQKFFRSQNALKYQTEGSGLGLHITKAIIEKSGGKIWFKSKEGAGTTFWFTLPMKQSKRST